MGRHTLKIILIICLATLCLTCANDKQVNNTADPVILNDREIIANYGDTLVFRYPDINSTDEIKYHNLPDWLLSDGDSVFGRVPHSGDDSFFDAVIYDGLVFDTITFQIRISPRFIIYGDTRSGHTTHQRIVENILMRKPKTVFHTGDLVNNGLLQSDWDRFFSISSELLSVTDYYPVIGNHENQSSIFFKSFDLPGNEQWYSLAYPGVRFIILNSCVETEIDSPQTRWLEKTLIEADKSKDFIVALFHHPPFSTGIHPDEQNIREKWVPLFEQYKVDIVFNGHNHCYEKLKCGSVYYIVTGGGGAPLYNSVYQLDCSQLYLKQYHFCEMSVTANDLYVRVYNFDNDMIDKIRLSKKFSP